MSDLGNKEIFSRNLKYYMNLYNKSRNDICKDLGFSYTTFTSWYNGDFYPRIDKIEMLANYFNIEKSDLIEEHHNNATEFDEQFKICGKRLTELRTNLGLTIEELSKKTNISTILLERYEKGIVGKMKQPTILNLANFYNVNPVWLMGYDVPMERQKEESNVFPVPDIPKKIPVVGKISAGMPILAVENIEGYEFAPSSQIKEGYTYFYLRVQGDSMNMKFNEGDIVLVQKQNFLENDEIGVILVNGDDATVKKYKSENGLIILEPMSTNPENTVQIYNPKNIDIKIIGKVISYQGKI